MTRTNVSRETKKITDHEDIPVEKIPTCPIETTLLFISNRWIALILRDLMDGTKRFSELKRSIGAISQKMLTVSLRDMEANGLVERTVYAEVPPRVEYALTEAGRSLKPVLDVMWAWGSECQRRLLMR